MQFGLYWCIPEDMAEMDPDPGAWNEPLYRKWSGELNRKAQEFEKETAEITDMLDSATELFKYRQENYSSGFVLSKGIRTQKLF